jgi:DNA-binding response OmpR family regulator
MRKHLVLFVQPEMARQFDFMKLYDSGLITDWVRDTKAAYTQLNAFVDVVVLDLSHDPDGCLAFCKEAKRQRGDRVVVLLRAEAVSVPDDSCTDLLLPRNVSQDVFVTQVTSLIEQHRRRAAS